MGILFEVLMKFKIFGKDVPVTVEDISHLGFDGLFNPKDWTIKIDTNCEMKFQTCMHELLHGLAFRIGIQQAKIPIEVEELIVENMATVLAENFDTLIKIRKMENAGRKVQAKRKTSLKRTSKK
jgi:hypothetical protein